jgi:hypothetical protein
MAPASAILADPLDFASAGVTIGVTLALLRRDYAPAVVAR